MIRLGDAQKFRPLFNRWKRLKILATQVPVALIQIVDLTEEALEELQEQRVCVSEAILAILMAVAAVVLNVQQTQIAQQTLPAGMLSNVWTLAGMSADWRPNVRW